MRKSLGCSFCNTPRQHVVKPPKHHHGHGTSTFSVLQSKTHVVLATLRRSTEELSSHQRKVFKIDDHIGIAVSGLNSDGRSLCRYMRNETLNHRQAAKLSVLPCVLQSAAFRQRDT